MFEQAIMAVIRGRIDGWWNGCSAENDSQREDSRDGSVSKPRLARVAHRSSTHFFALDNAFEIIDGMTKNPALGSI
jgi:hypothetical protein